MGHSLQTLLGEHDASLQDWHRAEGKGEGSLSAYVEALCCATGAEFFNKNSNAP